MDDRHFELQDLLADALSALEGRRYDDATTTEGAQAAERPARSRTTRASSAGSTGLATWMW